MRFAVTTAALLGVMVLGADALADGSELSSKDAGYAPPQASYSYSYSARSTRGSWTCPPEFTRRECQRIRTEVELRRAREIRRTRARVVYVDPRGYSDRNERRYVEDRPAPRSFGGKRCGGYFSVEGDARLTEKGPYSARSAAIKEWRHRVRTEGPGEQYVDEDYSPNFRVGKCRKIGDRGLLKRCTAEGTACRP